MNSDLVQALQWNRDWFLNSGVLAFANGSWGVAERIILAKPNDAVPVALEAFPSWTRIPEGYILEQRRADCAFQCAWYFLRLAKLFDAASNTATAHELLEFLYCRSGLLSHNKLDEPYPAGCWNWSHIRWTPSVYYDDNAWAVMIALAIAAEHPDWDAEFHMTDYALSGVRALYRAFAANFPEERKDDQPKWNGNLQLPHWGGLAAAALAGAYELAEPGEQVLWHDQILRYFHYVNAKLPDWNASELCYALLSVSLCEGLPGFRDSLLPLARDLARRIIGRMKPDTFLLPAEHYEAPSGGELADLIYTMNFAAVAFSRFCSAAPEEAASRAVRDGIIDFLLKIQDRDASPRLHGCWRGMYDVTTGQWGGGNHSEGGADSVYTGWTNAPIGWVLTAALSQQKIL